MSPASTDTTPLVRQNPFMVSGHPPAMKSPSGETIFHMVGQTIFIRLKLSTSTDIGKFSIQTHHSRSQRVGSPQRIPLSFQS